MQRKLMVTLSDVDGTDIATAYVDVPPDFKNDDVKTTATVRLAWIFIDTFASAKTSPVPQDL